MTRQISRMFIFEKWLRERRTDAINAYVLEKLGVRELPEDALRCVKAKTSNCVHQIEQRWNKSQRHRDRFLADNASWLEKNISFSNTITEALPGSSDGTSSKKVGRPQKPFEHCVAKVQSRKIKSLADSISSKELSKATELKLRKSGKRDSADIVKELCSASPTRGTAIKKARRSALENPAQLSADQALALIVDANLSTHQYNIIRDQAKELESKLYPSYYKVKEAKRLCYPSNIVVTETSAEILLQSLIDHTVTQLCKVQEEVLRTVCDDHSTLNIVIKWGCDGAEQKRYRQKFSEENYTDESLFSISMVPIQIYDVNNNHKTIIWQNPATSSTRYCRPIKFVFAKESVAVIRTEVEKVKVQITCLSPTTVAVGDKEFLVKPTMIFCMIDGKVCNAVSSCASTQTGYLCGARPSEMNNVHIISQKTVDENFLSFGLSPLHSWIRMFECVLHISYRLEIETWQIRGAENKSKVERKKKLVQERFRKELGLLVDMPKQQTGNTNDGNTARSFFRNAEKSAEITGVSLEMIQRFCVILECLNCGFPINLDKFEEYTKQTLELYLRNYSWYYMPVSVHKVLFHGRDIIAASILPIGQFSEEAQEARNKDSRKFREMFTRKTSRIDTNTDLLHRLLITSDPLIANLRVSPKTKHGQMTSEVLKLLIEPPVNDSYSNMSADHSDSRDSE